MICNSEAGVSCVCTITTRDRIGVSSLIDQDICMALITFSLVPMLVPRTIIGKNRLLRGKFLTKMTVMAYHV